MNKENVRQLINGLKFITISQDIHSLKTSIIQSISSEVYGNGTHNSSIKLSNSYIQNKELQEYIGELRKNVLELSIENVGSNKESKKRNLACSMVLIALADASMKENYGSHFYETNFMGEGFWGKEEACLILYSDYSTYNSMSLERDFPTYVRPAMEKLIFSNFDIKFEKVKLPIGCIEQSNPMTFGSYQLEQITKISPNIASAYLDKMHDNADNISNIIFSGESYSYTLQQLNNNGVNANGFMKHLEKPAATALPHTMHLDKKSTVERALMLSSNYLVSDNFLFLAKETFDKTGASKEMLPKFFASLWIHAGANDFDVMEKNLKKINWFIKKELFSSKAEIFDCLETILNNYVERMNHDYQKPHIDKFFFITNMHRHAHFYPHEKQEKFQRLTQEFIEKINPSGESDNLKKFSTTMEKFWLSKQLKPKKVRAIKIL